MTRRLLHLVWTDSKREQAGNVYEWGFSSQQVETTGNKQKTLVTEEGARTLDHKVKSLALYQLSYSGPCLRISSLGVPE